MEMEEEEAVLVETLETIVDVGVPEVATKYSWAALSFFYSFVCRSIIERFGVFTSMLRPKKLTGS